MKAVAWLFRREHGLMKRQLAVRAVLRGSLIGSALMTLFLLRPEPNLAPGVVMAVVIGTIVAVGTYRGGLGKASLPDGALVALFLAMFGVWVWVLVTGHHGLVVDGWLDGAAAALVMGIPVGGIALVVWNRRTTGRDLLHQPAGRK
jgi:hypothetical protein